jgi:LysM repeat protein
MPKLISATYHPNIEVAEFICDDGRHLLRHGGTLPWRINNPGDLTALLVDGAPAPKKAKGHIGFASTRSGRTFLIFPDEDAGRAELKANLKRRHGQKTIPGAIPSYAPSHENDTEKYIADLLRTSGVPADKKINECSDAEIEKIIDSISEIEGYHASAETRKETWAVVSTINATNGSQPLPDTEIILQTGNKEEKVKSDATGRFPPVIHPADKTAVQVKVMNSKTKKIEKVGEIQGGVGKDFNLLAKFAKWTGVAGSEKMNSSMPGKKKSTHHVVQPGDNLGKIANLYRTSVTAIKVENGLGSDNIYPGEVLLIAGPGKKKSNDAPTVPATAMPEAAPTNSPTAIPKRRSRPSAAPVLPVFSGTQSSDSERSKEGTGKVLALINPLPGRAPWMPIAVAEAKLRHGKEEGAIQREINYHTEIGDGSRSMADTAWCAAFANWVLSQANYPIDNTNFYDHKAATGRAHGFYEVSGPKEKKSDPIAPTIRNPLYIELDTPIYGAIAMVTSKTGHGHHVGFVYAKSGNDNLILLGGNQHDQIRFSPFSKIFRPPVKIKGKNGEMVVKNEGSPDYLKYFIPVAYYEQAKKDLIDPGLEQMDFVALNLELGIPPDKSKKNKGHSNRDIL